MELTTSTEIYELNEIKSQTEGWAHSRLKLKPYVDTFQLIASGCTCGCLQLPQLVEKSRLKRDKTLPEWASTSTPQHVERFDVFETAHSSLRCKSSQNGMLK